MTLSEHAYRRLVAAVLLQAVTDAQRSGDVKPAEWADACRFLQSDYGQGLAELFGLGGVQLDRVLGRWREGSRHITATMAC